MKLTLFYMVILLQFQWLVMLLCLVFFILCGRFGGVEGKGDNFIFKFRFVV